MKRTTVGFAIIDAPSVLGLGETGVELLPEAFRAVGFHDSLNAEYLGLIAPPRFDPEPDPETKLPSTKELLEYSPRLADAVTKAFDVQRFPVVLGGDCSIIIGTLLALRRAGRYGLFFIDGHADFYTPEASDIGLASDMELRRQSKSGSKRASQKNRAATWQARGSDRPNDCHD